MEGNKKKKKKTFFDDSTTYSKENEKSKLQSKEISIEDMATFCRRKGFVYPSAEIYGGLAGFWDFGHLGVELANNIKKEWWKFHVYNREDIVGIDGSIITNPKVWEASGHVSSFIDMAVICRRCGNKTKIDKHEVGKVKCEKCKGEFEVKGEFNPMFTTQVGPIKEDSLTAYLRPETAQLIFTNFKYVYDNARLKLPCGIAQIGKAFRNEIAPRDFLFRAREFEQMEIEYFVKPNSECPYKIGHTNILVYSAEMQEKNKEAEKMSFKEIYEKGFISDWHAYWLEQEFLWFIGLGANPSKFRIRQHLKDEKSHYALDTWDLEYKFPFGWKELEGMANRTDFDLKQHENHSGKDLKIFNEETKEKFLPHVVCEPSLGVGRAFLVFMFDSYSYDEQRGNIVLRLHPKLAPIKVAIFPIVKRKDFEKLALEIFKDLRTEWNVIFDNSGSIGRRYSRQDESGTPFCITIDEDSLKKNDVTIRDRDSGEQIRVKIKDLKEILKKSIDGGEKILKFGKI
ncbi:glycine--tRNA ligase, partial [Candidatus Pacearchaeota archaeon]